MNNDRTVHGLTDDGGEIVRYDRAGKWYFEYRDRKRRHVTIAEAVQAAAAGKAVLGRAGGLAFDAKVRKLRGEAGR